jgi:hypothetical protein
MGRTIIVGDVHGCADELDKLLDLVAASDDDRIVFVGDLIMRGPKPREVLARARERKAASVLGNHEWRLLQWRRCQTKNPSQLSSDQERIRKNSRLAALASQLSSEDWAQLEAMPLHLELPQHRLLVVHAGMVPQRNLKEQRPRDLLHMRCLDELGQALEPRESGPLWGSVYNGPPHIVFGHNARSEPQIHPWATGIDTGCVYGGRLTALILAAEQAPFLEAKKRLGQLASVAALATYVAIPERRC